MLKDNLELLDIDEQKRKDFEKIHSSLLDFCEKYDLVLDLATSDINIFIHDKYDGTIVLADALPCKNTPL